MGYVNLIQSMFYQPEGFSGSLRLVNSPLTRRMLWDIEPSLSPASSLCKGHIFHHQLSGTLAGHVSWRTLSALLGLLSTIEISKPSGVSLALNRIHRTYPAGERNRSFKVTLSGSLISFPFSPNAFLELHWSRKRINNTVPYLSVCCLTESINVSSQVCLNFTSTSSTLLCSLSSTRKSGVLRITCESSRALYSSLSIQESYRTWLSIPNWTTLYPASSSKALTVASDSSFFKRLSNSTSKYSVFSSFRLSSWLVSNDTLVFLKAQQGMRRFAGVVIADEYWRVFGQLQRLSWGFKFKLLIGMAKHNLHRGLLTLRTIFPRVPQAQHIDGRSLDFIPNLVLPNQNTTHFARFKLPQLLSNTRIGEQSVWGFG